MGRIFWISGLENCDQICYKDPVLKDRQWSVYFDRSPGAAGYSEECFHACVTGCGFKFEIPPEKVDQVHPNRPTKPPPPDKPPVEKPPVETLEPSQPSSPAVDIPSTSA